MRGAAQRAARAPIDRPPAGQTDLFAPPANDGAPMSSELVGREVSEVVATVRGRDLFLAVDGSVRIVALHIPGVPGGPHPAIFRPAIETPQGCQVRVSGRFALDRKGRISLLASRAEPLRPDGAGGVAAWLRRAAVEGVGEKTVQRLVARLGDALADAVGDADRLERDGGLRRALAERIAARWGRDEASSRARALLSGHGLAARRVNAVMEAFGDAAVERISRDPWSMMDVPGVGFATCESVAKSLGFPPDHPLRLRRVAAEAMGSLSDREGHTCAPRDLLETAADRLLNPRGRWGGGGAAGRLASEAVDLALAAGDLVLCPDVGAIYRPGLLDAERRLARDLARLARGGGLCARPEAERAVTAAEGETGVVLDRDSGQWEAAVQALSSGLSVITGGPGTGKSTIQRVVVAAARSLRGMGDRQRVQIAAPTGRAAKRLSETSGEGATTVHRMLEFSPLEGRFLRNRSNPLPGRLVIIDEASMADTPMGRSAAEAVATGASLVLVGDIDQLPSVGPGQVLRDVIDSGVAPVVRLTRVRRTDAGSEIPIAADRVRRGLHPVAPGERLEGVHLIEPRRQEDIPDIVRRVMAERVANLGVDPDRDVQVMAAMKRGEAGVESLNEAIRLALNPSPPSAARVGAREYGIGDRVMNIRNDDAAGLSNGDIGRVCAVLPGREGIHVDFGDGNIACFDSENADNLVHARCVTVHKAQGSEFPVVVVVVPDAHAAMLDRNLFYTGLTRARSHVVVVGAREAVARACARERASKRITGLLARLAAVAPDIARGTAADARTARSQTPPEPDSPRLL